jgi:hypothetical protein
MVAALAVDTKKGIASSEEVRNRQTKTTEAPQAKAPEPKRVFTEEERAQAFAVYTLVETKNSEKELEHQWKENFDLLEVEIGGVTLRNHILARRAAING